VAGINQWVIVNARRNEVPVRIRAAVLPSRTAIILSSEPSP
jgi:hypothetical protein